MELNIFNTVSKKELWWFINKFSIFINSWIDIKATLSILVKQIKNPYFRRIISEMKENIDHWVNIHETCKDTQKCLIPYYCIDFSLRKTWQLWRILSELDTNLQENIELKWKVKSALIYPIIL